MSLIKSIPFSFVVFENVETGELFIAKTDAEGKCEIVVPKGTYNVYVFKEGFLVHRQKVIVTSNTMLFKLLKPMEKIIGLSSEIKIMPPIVVESTLDINSEVTITSGG